MKKSSDSSGSHKDRAVWFAERTCWPLRDASPAALESVWKDRAAAPPSKDTAAWECAGPFNVGGRVTALVVHPSDPNILFAGAAAGGVWRSTDGGQRWDTNWPKTANPHIGALAL